MDIEEKELEIRKHCCEYIFCQNCVLFNTPCSCKFDTSDDKEIEEMYDIIKNTPSIPQANPLEEIIESMAYEIAKHRYPNKYEYDDGLINEIIKEFS